MNELHFRRYNEALANGCNEKEAMALADNWELLKDAQRLFEFHHDVAGRSEEFYCVSSNALVYGKPCEKWCGDENCKALCKQ